MLVRRPLNAAVIQGSAVTFECSSDVGDSVITWLNSLCVTTSPSVNQCTNDFIYNGYDLANVPASFSVTSVSSSAPVTRDININPTQLTDAGVYLCAELQAGVVGVSDSGTAQLIVLGDFILHF